MNPQAEARRSTAGPGGGPAFRRTWPKTASGGLTGFRPPKPAAKPRPAWVSGTKRAEGVTHSVMDTLDYGISSPQLAMMGNGEVFVAGQYEPPMNPPTTQTQTQAKTSGIRPMLSGALPSIIIGSDLFGFIGVQPFIKVVPNPQGNYIAPTGGSSGIIPGTSSPLMPIINASVIGVDPGTYQISWTPVFTYTARWPNPPTFVDNSFAPVTGQGVQCPNMTTLLGGYISGGNLTLNASGQVTGVAGGGGLAVTAVPNTIVSGSKGIFGINPTESQVNAALTVGDLVLPNNTTIPGSTISQWIQAIAWLESSGKLQFAPSNNYGNNKYNFISEPIQSFDGGIGMMQITQPTLPGEVQMQLMWDWTANANFGMNNIFMPGLKGIVYNYPAQIFKNIMTNKLSNNNNNTALQSTNNYRINSNKPLLSQILVPPFTANQIIFDAVRAYNGYGPYPLLSDQFGSFLHEYTLSSSIDSTYGLVIQVINESPDPNNPSCNIGTAIWNQVPGVTRYNIQVNAGLKIKGDPYYVDNVTAQLGK